MSAVHTLSRCVANCFNQSSCPIVVRLLLLLRNRNQTSILRQEVHHNDADDAVLSHDDPGTHSDSSFHVHTHPSTITHHLRTIPRPLTTSSTPSSPPRRSRRLRIPSTPTRTRSSSAPFCSST